jgi:RNA polymerase sigma-70 factor, ECF subfamily
MQNHTTTLSAASDEELVLLAQAGAAEAFGELVRRHRKAAVRLAATILRNGHDAEDEAQNAFTKAFEHIARFERGCRFTTWLTRIVVNQCLMRMRQARRRRNVSLDEPREVPVVSALADDSQAPDAGLSGAQLRCVLEAEVRRIPPLLRHPFELRHVHHLPVPEVARRLGISVPAAKSRLLRARLELQHRLRRHQGHRGPATLFAS